MRVRVLPDADAIGAWAAELVAGELRGGGLRVLGVATGSSPSPVYAALGAMSLPGWDRVQVFALDEYVGLGPADPHSYHAVIDAEVRRPLGIPAAHVHVPDGTAADPDLAGKDYDAALAACGGVDVQLLGIGATGHIGFNEPGSPLDSRTRVVMLSERTRADNARFFDRPGDVPHRALTQGVGTIREARRHVLIARGTRKADAVRAALQGPVSPACPASALQTVPDLTVLLDPGAASRLDDTARSG